MNDVKKDHSLGAGTGAVAGAVTGAAIGSAAGPVGSLVGAVAGGIVGAKAGDSIAEAVNPTEYEDHFKNTYNTREYYKADRDWNDYQPAYRYAYDARTQYTGKSFDTVEPELERDWDTRRGNSRLAWSEAREPVRDGWHHIERAIPGDADRDGR
jgi:hypothetical protein